MIEKVKNIHYKLSEEKNSLIWLIFIFVILLFLYYFYPKEIEPETENNITKIIQKMFDDPNEYVNEEFINTLSPEEKIKIKKEIKIKIYKQCEENQINQQCNLGFVVTSLKILSLLGNDTLPPEKIKGIYLSLKENFYNYNFTAINLRDFTLPFIFKLCKNRFLDMNESEEKEFWNRKVINVSDKDNWEDTHMQVLYFYMCFDALDVNTAAKKINVDKRSLKTKICNILPTIYEIDENDLCELRDYLGVKLFCEEKISKNEWNIINSKLSKNYNTNYQKSCKKILKNFINTINYTSL